MNKNDFTKLLEKPKVPFLPKDFDINKESVFLAHCYEKIPVFQNYVFKSFINAGSSAMLFQVTKDNYPLALKVARKETFEQPGSHFTWDEHRALATLHHPNIVKLYDVIDSKDRIVAFALSYANKPQGLDLFLEKVLNDEKPKSSDEKPYDYFISPERLASACEIIFSWIYEIASALEYMHENGYCHLDIKPANILIYGKNPWRPLLVDMGSCQNLSSGKKTVNFTIAYAHPELTDIKRKSNPTEGDLIRSSTIVKDAKRLPIYDLYAFGKTIQQILEIIHLHFKEMCFSNYTFRFLHIIAALLLDGQNIKKQNNVIDTKIDGRNKIQFAGDFPMDYCSDIFRQRKITSARDLVVRLKRYNSDYFIAELSPEFNIRNKNVVNNTVEDVVPFTNRIKAIFNHIAFRRLHKEMQLGFMIEIYPGASHNRWSHSLGVFGVTLKYYSALLSDPENPMLKIIINKNDLEHAFLSAILHDIGQTSYGHDFEIANNEIFSHTGFIKRILQTEIGGQSALEKTIRLVWGEEISIDRIVNIINRKSDDVVDSIASDIIDGALDADKLDYIKRDSYYCGVAYGDGVDYGRIMDSLTISESNKKLKLAYYSKGRAAISSLLLARYQLYGSVYWHHSFRAIQTMFVYAIIFAYENKFNLMAESLSVDESFKKSINDLFFHRVICKKAWSDCFLEIGMDLSDLNDVFRQNSLYEDDFGLDFVHKTTTLQGQKLLKDLYERNIYKRIFSKSLHNAKIEILKESCADRVGVSKLIQKKLINQILEERKSQSGSFTQTELQVGNEVTDMYRRILENEILVLIDLPRKISIPGSSWPLEVSDSTRKLQHYGAPQKTEKIVESTNNLLQELACFRVFAEPNFYKIVTRYLTPKDIEAAVKDAISFN